MPRVACVGCGAEFLCSPSFRGKTPKCRGCRPPTQARRDATAAARSAPQNGAAGAPQPSHMTPCACHCAACRAAGHGNGACVVLCAGLHALFDGKADVVDLVLRQYYGACGWGTARLDAVIHCVQYGPGLGDVIAAGADDGRIHFICAQTGEKILCPLRGHDSVVSSLACVVSSLAFKPDDPNVLITGSYDTTVKLWDLSTSTCLSTMTGHTSNVTGVAFHPTKNLVASCSVDKSVKLWNADSGAELWTVSVDAGFGGVQSVSFSPKGDMVAAGCANGKIFFVDPTAGEIKSSLNVDGDVSTVAFSIDGSKIAAAFNVYDDLYEFQNGGVKIFSNQGSAGFVCQSTLRGHSDFSVSCVSFKPDKPNIVVSSSYDTTIKTWDITSGSCLSTLRGHSDFVNCVAFKPDNPNIVVSGSDDKTIKTWDITS